MKEIQFERIEDKYKLIIETCERIVSEEEAIELMVTLLRANYEVNYLIERKKEIVSSASIVPLELITKSAYNLTISFLKQKIVVSILEFENIDYSTDEYSDYCEEIYQLLNREYGKGFDFKLFSPIYLEHMLGIDLPNIKRIEQCKTDILSLTVFDREGPSKVRIYEHEIYNQLKTGDFKQGRKTTNHLFENNEERIRNVLSKVKKDSKDACAVVYGDEDVVRDGTHRLACMYFLYGNIEIPIIRIYVKNPQYSYSMHRRQANDSERKVIR